MRNLISLLLLLLSSTAFAQASPQDQVAGVLDDFHQAAAQADGERYFGHFTDDAVFLGTDITERWSLEEFKAYALPHFSKGRGWEYRAKSRHIYLSQDGKTAWFDEILLNQKFGETRGSGVLVREGARWKVAQYHLTLPVPNDLIEDLVQRIQAQSQE